jgi:glycosyltransferase involved in cell wall biosynthesis
MEESLAALRAVGIDARAWLATPASASEPEAERRLERRGIPVETRRAALWLAPGAVAALRRSLKLLGPGAVLHTHGERALLWGRVAAPLAGVSHVHTQHGFVAQDVRARGRVALAKQLASGLSALIAVDPATRGGRSEAHIVPNCLDASSFAAEAGDPEALRRGLGLEDGEPCCLFMGRLSPEKGADLLARVQARLQASSGAARLCVAGTGSLALGVGAMSGVRLLGARSDAASLLLAADVLLMPSRSEGLPMVALEAAALGTPVVAFPAGGLADSGLAACVPMEDVGALVETGLELVRDPARRTEQLARSRAVLEERFSPSDHATALRRVYLGL